MTLEGKHAVVSGGGTGIGAAIAEALAHDGAKVTVLGRREGPLRDVAKKHKFIGWITCDVTDAAAVNAAFRQARGLNGPVDIVVANAGAADSAPFARTSPDDLTSMLDVNLKGVFTCFQAALSDMEAAGEGRMIAIASTAGLKGYPYVAAYCAAKHGVIGLVRALARELAPGGITVNAVCPGFVETPLLERSIHRIAETTGLSEEDAARRLKTDNPQGRFIQPDEVAKAVLWLASEAARSVNGHALSLSGGEI